jgi:hypothetical protein
MRASRERPEEYYRGERCTANLNSYGIYGVTARNA